MFGWGRGKRAKRLSERIFAGDDPAGALSELPEKERAPAVLEVMRQLAFDDRHDTACAFVDAAFAAGVDDEDVLLAGENAFAVVGKLERSVELCQQALDRRPESDRLVRRLALRLLDVRRPAEALELLEAAAVSTPEQQLVRGNALLALERPAEALPILEAVIDYYELEMKQTLDRSMWTAARDRCHEARELHDAAHAELHGAESVVASAANLGNLANAGGNYRLLAESLMVECEHVPATTELEAPERTLERLRDKRGEHDDAATLALRGCALLRVGRPHDARHMFEAACELDGTHFAGFRGLGTTRDIEQLDLLTQAARLPEHPCPPLLPSVVSDWPALTDLERKIVIASAHPLRGALPRLAAAGARIRLLPIDVRTVDLPEWKRDAGARFTDDHRAMDALGGVASSTQQLAAARIEALLDVVSPSGFVFAHELAHLAFFQMEDPSAVLELYDWAAEIPYIASSYQMSNADEFFACAYQDYLRAHYGLRSYREPDDQGVWAAVVELFDGLGDTAMWSSGAGPGERRVPPR
jgi:tetratricopeptide (TPR) repeat protein